MSLDGKGGEVPGFIRESLQYHIIPLDFAMKPLRQTRPIPRLRQERVGPAQDQVQIAATVAVVADNWHAFRHKRLNLD